MAGRSLTRVQGGVTDTIHINTDKFAGVRTMGRSDGTTIFVDRTAPVIDSDPVGQSRPILSKLVGGAKAAYSLRDLNDKQGDNKVIRVRRESDNHERDFLAKEISNGTLESFVNSQVTAPLDIKGLTSTGRNGNFLIPRAAYSLRSLGTRQATVSATGDTVARADGKYVCQVRRSSDNALKSFTADEITDGTLLSFVGTSGSDNGFVSKWYDQSVSNQAGDTATGNHATQSHAAFQPKIVDAGSFVTDGGLLFGFGSNQKLDFTGFTNQEEVSIFSVVKFNDLDSGSDIIGADGGDASFGIVDDQSYSFANNATEEEGDLSTTLNTSSYNLMTMLFGQSASDADVVTFTNGIEGELIDTNSGDFEANTIGDNGSFGALKGNIKEIIIYDFKAQNDRAAIEANIGEHYSISGIPAFNNSVNGFVETWYDQSGNGNDLSQPTASRQPTIVTSGVLNTRNNKPIVKFIQANSTHLTGASSIFPTGTDIAMTVFQAMHVDASSGNRIGLFGHNGGGNSPANNKYMTGSNTSRKTILKTRDASGTVVSLQSNVVSANNADAIITYFNSSSDGTATHSVFNLGAQVGSTLTASNTDQSYQSGNIAILGSRTTNDNYSDSEFFEVIAYDSDQLANRPAIEANLSNQYGIALS
ncbi:MAG: hypothetical protein Unbinned4294contig1001_31 [Prokaryotic dsDNA virus sp.]|mgnify:FL=1|jgi:hypothetical protein|nr:MAG: hypothetical protein Unbinned4294contig1001_31 [Prokaryotic dsDNA virus sp.]|tara:strand:+ start:1342 stop:3276 length:1935 start_codon:yes stop_codon:yes gene_type:complete